MPTYLHPGVYMEELPGGARPIEGVPTSIAALIGTMARGAERKPVLIHSFAEYEAEYGPIADKNDEMGFAARAYYQNGGRDAYFVRVIGAASKAHFLDLENSSSAKVLTVSASSAGDWGQSVYVRVTTASGLFTLDVGHYDGPDFIVDESYSKLDMNPRSDNYALTRVNLASPRIRLALGGDAIAQIEPGTLVGGAHPTSSDSLKTSLSALTAPLTLRISLNGLEHKTATVNLGGMTWDGDNSHDGPKVASRIESAVRAIAPGAAPYAGFTAAYAADKFTLTSTDEQTSQVSLLTTPFATALKLDAASSPTATPGWSKLTPATVSAPTPLDGGSVADAASSDIAAVFDELKKIATVSVVLLPGTPLDASGAHDELVSAALAHCEETKSRMLVLDPPAGVELKDRASVQGMVPPSSTYSVLYYPHVRVTNPFYKPGIDDEGQATVKVGPSAFAAGTWSRVDASRGVWKAPAGVETGLIGVARLESNPGDAEQNELNPLGVNCFRVMPGFGPVIWGARTLATNSNPEWRYVPVRRTAIMIEQSIYNGIQWAVFEPNDHRLWSALRANVGSFMDSLFRAGAFQGEKASDAYFVRCHLGDTMTQGDIDRGQVVVLVGFAPLKPAEFVIVRIQQKVQQS